MVPTCVLYKNLLMYTAISGKTRRESRIQAQKAYLLAILSCLQVYRVCIQLLCFALRRT